MMRRISWCVAVGLLVIGGAVAAATLSDFKDAEGKEGCDSIPYDGIRDRCQRKSGEVRDLCKNSSRPISCEDLDPSGLTKQIENVSGKVADLKRERDELASKISGTTDDSQRRDLEDKKKAKEDEIYKLEQLLSKWQSQLSNEKTEVGNRIYNGEHCVAAREEVAKVFFEAKSSAKSESDPEIKPYAEKLIAKWERGESTHADEIRKYNDAVAKCKNMR